MMGIRFLAMVAAVAVLIPGQVSSPAVAAASQPVVAPTVGSGEVSHDGRFVWDAEAYQVVDRLTGARSAVPACTAHQCWTAGFVRDRPTLVLHFEFGSTAEYPDSPGNRAPLRGLYLVDTVTGARQRVDTDSSGAPLTSSWEFAGCGNEWCDNFFDYPQVFAGAQSVSRNGRIVAFCTNYAKPKVPELFVKDLRTGRLTKPGVLCPVMDTGGTVSTRPPEISANGRVVHVNGDVVGTTDPDYLLRWNADSLYFTRGRSVRTVPGWGSMTRDGGSVFMRTGVPRAALRRSKIAVGVYSVGNRRITRVPGRNEVYGTAVEDFRAFDMASYRGRFVVGAFLLSDSWTDVSLHVTDRRTGVVTDLAATLSRQGHQPVLSGDSTPVISGNGRVVLAEVAPAQGGGSGIGGEQVAITGWEPTVRARVSANASATKLLVDVDPDKGSGYWTFGVQAQRADGSWRTLKRTYRTLGARETRTIDLPAGTYRVTVRAKYGYLGSMSSAVTLTR